MHDMEFRAGFPCEQTCTLNRFELGHHRPRFQECANVAAILRRNVWIYGVGGIIVPFIGIKLIDMLITRVGLA